MGGEGKGKRRGWYLAAPIATRKKCFDRHRSRRSLRKPTY
jgi:hypothetical protein